MQFNLLNRRRFLGALSAAATMLAAPWAQAKRLQLPQRLIMLDPGHGGIDPGCIGASGVFEKDIALATALELARELEGTGRFRVRLTRDEDEFIPLADRVARARAANADLFLSIHADALPDERFRGATVFTLSEQASDREAALIAARENQADLVAGVDLSHHAPEVANILLDLAQRETNNESIRLARDLVSELSRRVTMLQNSHRSAGFAVLKAPDIPSALVEIGALSNRQEESLLQLSSYRRKLAVGLTRSVDDFFNGGARV
ncbi:MAG TPA: N-acetylmuramoyl-L-alanine amidase [Stellaceae bacterium]|nr:N-acetylmuramoyl-L-alanine amidase [Stellaceae bacterium]